MHSGYKNKIQEQEKNNNNTRYLKKKCFVEFLFTIRKNIFTILKLQEILDKTAIVFHMFSSFLLYLFFCRRQK